SCSPFRIRWISVSSWNGFAELSRELTSSGIAPHRKHTAIAHGHSSVLYSGSFFHPVNIETKLLQPCSTTITRCPNTNAKIAHMIRKCHSRAQWNPPISQASHENCTGFHTAKPVTTDNTPSPIADVYACFWSGL